MKQKSVLKLTNLTIQRDETVILHNVSWEVNRGEHWAILGANGSGKTSLLSALAGYLMPTRGDIDLLGNRYGESDWRELRKKIGFVSSSIRQVIHDHEIAIEIVATGKYAMIDYWGELSPSDRRQAERILSDLGCKYLAERCWAVLSQGERQRILIGRALMAKPSLLILDEPCAGLDPVSRQHFLDFVGRLAKSKTAPVLVLVTHHIEEIGAGISHVLILKAGRVLAYGEKNRVLTSQNLSRAFGDSVRVKRSGSEFYLEVRSKTKKIA